MKDEVSLELEARKMIYDSIFENPGLHLREIQKRLEIPLGTVEYHLKYLEDNDLVIVKEMGGYKRYYPKGVMGSDVRNILSLLRQEIPRSIVIFLLNHQDATFGEVAKAFNVAPSTLSFHMKKLLKEGIIERKKMGRKSIFRVIEAHKVANVLIAHRRSFLDGLVDSFVETWTRLQP